MADRQIPPISENSSAGFFSSRSKYEYPLRAPNPAVTLSPNPTNKIFRLVQTEENISPATDGPAGPEPFGRAYWKNKYAAPQPIKARPAIPRNKTRLRRVIG